MDAAEQRRRISSQRGLDQWYRERGSRDMSKPAANENAKRCIVTGCQVYTRSRYCTDHWPRSVS